MLGMCLLFGSEKLYGQREVIATAETVTNPAPLTSFSSAVSTSASAGQTIQSTSYVPISPPSPEERKKKEVGSSTLTPSFLPPTVMPNGTASSTASSVATTPAAPTTRAT